MKGWLIVIGAALLFIGCLVSFGIALCEAPTWVAWLAVSAACYGWLRQLVHRGD